MKTTLRARLVKIKIFRTLIRFILYICSKILYPIKTIKEIYRATKDFIFSLRDAIMQELNFYIEQFQAYESTNIPIPRAKPELWTRFKNKMKFIRLSNNTAALGNVIYPDIYDPEDGYPRPMTEQEFKDCMLPLPTNLKIPGQRPPREQPRK